MVDITAPHAFCDESNPERNCDRVARAAADALHQALIQRGITSHEMSAHTLRSDCDLNRDVCYNHPFRIQVRNHVESDPGVRVLIDVHSFPPQDPSWGSLEVVVLDDYSTRMRSLAAGIYTALVDGGADVIQAQGVTNSIQDEFNRGGIQSTLIEFNEGLSNQRLFELCEIIADHLARKVSQRASGVPPIRATYTILGDMESRGYAFGEVVSYVPESRKPNLISITQAVILGFFFVTFVFFLLENEHVRFINVYVYTVTYGSVGAFLILILQPIGFIGYMWKNRIRSGKKMAGEGDHSYMGAHHTRELVIGLVASILGFLTIMWELISWLNRFDKTCCLAANSDPTIVAVTDGLTDDEITMALFMQWRVYYAAFTLSSFISLINCVFMLRAVLAHFAPLRVITAIYGQAT